MTPAAPEVHQRAGTNGEGITLSFTQKIVAGVTIAALVGVLGMVFDARSQLARQNVQIEHIQQSIETQMDDRYRAGDAARDLALRDAAIAVLRVQFEATRITINSHTAMKGHPVMERLVADLEKRINRLEQGK